MPEINQPEYIEFDVATVNNMGNNIKVRNISIYKDEYDPPNDDKIKERLASELGYEGLGEYIVYAHNPALDVGDQVPDEVELLHTVSIAVSSISAVMTSAVGESDWIPVAAVDQKTRLTLKSGDVTLSISEDALKSHLDSWAGGYINVNHADNAEIEGLEIEDAKFENGLLYHKVSPKVAEFIRQSASSGRSIEIKPLRIVDNEVVEFSGLGLSVLYPPYKPSCSTDMGCSSSPIKEVFTKLANKLKSHSSMNEDSGINPHLETSMNEDIDKLKFAKMEADKSRDEALKEAETLKFSLAEKDTALTEKDKLLTEQTDKLKFYADAEAVAAEKRTDEQWETLKSSIPPGKFHKPDDEAALKQEFISDPAGFAVKMVSFAKEDPKGESGAEFVAGDPSSDEAADMRVLSEINQKSGRIY